MLLRYRLARTLFHIIVLIFGPKRVRGRENLPEEGPYILVGNHMSVADTPLLFVSLPVMKIRFFAGEKWEKLFFVGWFMRWLGAIYIDRTRADFDALKEALRALAAGDPFGLAPEGRRSKVGHLIRGRDGAAYLASKSGVTLVPVAVTGTERVFANARRLRRTPMSTTFGRPFTLPRLGRRVRTRDLPAYTHLIMVHIAALLPPEYRGDYADSPALAALLAGEDPWPHCLAAEGVAPPAA